MADLTDREHQMVRLVRLGYTNREIGRSMGIRSITVKQRLSQVYKKLRIDTGKAGASRALLAVEEQESIILTKRAFMLR